MHSGNSRPVYLSTTPLVVEGLLTPTDVCSCCGKPNVGLKDTLSAALCHFAHYYDAESLHTLITAQEAALLRRVVHWCREWQLPIHWAEDVLQMSLVKVVRKAPRFDCSKPVWPWLTTVVQRTFLDFYRSQARKHHKRLPKSAVSEVFEGDDTPEPTADEKYAPEQAALCHERDELLERAIAALPMRERFIFRARRLGVTNRKIAAKLECSEGAASSEYAAIVRQLRAELQ